MVKHLTTLAIIISCIVQLNAQRGQAIYAELLGGAIVYSVNYDTRFSEGEDDLGGRIGLSVLDETLVVPLHLNYVLGPSKHKLEIGAGFTTLIGYGFSRGDLEVVASAAMMYRFQKEDGHFLFRAGLSPSFVRVEEDVLYGNIGRIFWFWPGVSFGYKF